MSFIMRLIRLIIVFLPLIHYLTSYKKVIRIHFFQVLLLSGLLSLSVF